MNRKKTITIQPYGYKITIIITEDVVKARKKYDKFMGSECQFSELSALHSHNYIDPISIIFLKQNPDLRSVVHESFHAVISLYKFYDIPLDNNTEEVYAYTLEYIVDKILSFIKYPINNTVQNKC